jgi:hypothetical protein
MHLPVFYFKKESYSFHSIVLLLIKAWRDNNMRNTNDPRYQEIMDFTTSKPEFNSLGVGPAICRIGRWELVNSFEADFNGTAKATMPEWEDPTAQVAVTFVEYLNNGAITHRFNTRGYVRLSDYDDKPEELKKIKAKFGEIKESAGYLLVKVDGKWIRAKDEERTAKALNILNSLCNALGLAEGQKIDALDKARDDKYLVGIEVVKDTYQDREILKVAPRFKTVPQEYFDAMNKANGDFE